MDNSSGRSVAFSGLHKRKPVGFANIPARREEDSNRLKNDRRARRTDCFNLNRNIEPNVCEEKALKEHDKMFARKKELKDYIMKKKALKEMELKKKRPPFIVGVVHHGTSPILKEVTNTRGRPKILNQIPNKEVRTQRVTRASAKMDMGGHDRKKPATLVTLSKRSKNVKKDGPVHKFPLVEMKSGFNFCKAKPLTSPHTPIVLKRSAKKKPDFTSRPPNVNKNCHMIIKSKNTSSNGTTETLATEIPDIKQLPEEEIPSSNVKPNFFEIENQVKKENVQETNVNVLTRRNTRQLSNVTFFSPPPGSSQQKARESAVHRENLEREKCRLLELADKWQDTAQHNDLPQDITDEVDSVVGQTRLLTKDKFKQFSGLIDQFENDFDSQNFTNNDLIGFWEMMYLQVDALDKRYSELEVLKITNWIKANPPMKKNKNSSTKQKKKPSKTPSSLFREMIKSKRTETATSTSIIQEKEKIISPVQKSRKSDFTSPKTPRHSASAFIAMRISSAGRSAGRADAMINSSLSAATPNSSYNYLEEKMKTEIKEETPITTPQQKTRNSVSKNLSSSVTENDASCSFTDVKPIKFSEHYSENVDTTMGSSQPVATPTTINKTKVNIVSNNSPEEKNDVQDIRDATSLRSKSSRNTPNPIATSLRRSMRVKNTPTPRKLCDVCDSPDCNLECNRGSKRRKQSMSSKKTRFQLKPSRLIVPKELDVEMSSKNSIVQKSATKNSEKLFFEESNFKLIEDDVQHVRPSFYKTRSSKVTFSPRKKKKVDLPNEESD